MATRPKNHPFFVNGNETDVKSYARMHVSIALDKIEEGLPAHLEGVPAAVLSEIFAESRRLADRIRQAFKHVK